MKRSYLYVRNVVKVFVGILILKSIFVNFMKIKNNVIEWNNELCVVNCFLC